MPPTPLDAELEPYLDVRREGRPLSAFIDDLTDAEHGALARVALVMFRSDALLAGTAVPMLDWLEEELGVVALRLSVRRVDARSFDKQYVTELPLIAGGLWLHHRIAAAGPTAYALVTGPPIDDRSLAAALDDLKGASSPASETSRDTMRSRFRRQSSFHVVLHTSEDAGDFLQGAIDVFGWPVVRQALGAVSRGDAVPVPRAHRDVLLGELAAPQDRNVYEVVLSVKRRILAVLASGLAGGTGADSPGAGGPDGSVAGAVPAELVERLDRCYLACDLPGADLFADTRERFMAMARAERPLLASLIDHLESVAARTGDGAPGDDGSTRMAARWRRIDDAAAPRKLAYASWLLSGHEEYDVDEGQGLVDLLAASSIVLSPWEQTLLGAAVVCDVNPGASFAGRRTYPLDPPG